MLQALLTLLNFSYISYKHPTDTIHNRLSKTNHSFSFCRNISVRSTAHVKPHAVRPHASSHVGCVIPTVLYYTNHNLFVYTRRLGARARRRHWHCASGSQFRYRPVVQLLFIHTLHLRKTTNCTTRLSPATRLRLRFLHRTARVVNIENLEIELDKCADLISLP